MIQFDRFFKCAYCLVVTPGVHVDFTLSVPCYRIGGIQVECSLKSLRSIIKAVADVMEGAVSQRPGSARQFAKVAEAVADYGRLSPEQLAKKISQLEQQMYAHARNLEFEEAARLRDEIRLIEKGNLGMTA